MICSGVYETEIEVSCVVVDCASAGTSAGNRDVGDKRLGEVDLVPGVLSATNYDAGTVDVEEEDGGRVG